VQPFEPRLDLFVALLQLAAAEIERGKRLAQREQVFGRAERPAQQAVANPRALRTSVVPVLPGATFHLAPTAAAVQGFS